MRRWCRAAFALLAALSLVSQTLSAQSVALSLSGITSDSTSPAPFMTVTGFENHPELGPYVSSITLSLESRFQTPFYANAAQGEVATFRLDSLLPERTIIYFRARLSDRFGNVVAERVEQHPVRSWVRLIFPNRGPTTIVDTRTPRFVWSSPQISTPPGPWVYDLEVINTRTGTSDFPPATGLTDTTFVFPDSLESNTSYRWRVHARAQTGPASDQVTVASQGTFVIATSPTATIFYPNFPNPFGAGMRSNLTCFWFDLARQATVKLTIYDIRLHEVRKIIPSPVLSAAMGPGQYGRENVNTSTGCDERFAWDGRDARGQSVMPGVYIAVFEADGVRQMTKIQFRGP